MTPRISILRRTSDRTMPDDFHETPRAPADRADVEARLRQAPGPCRLSVTPAQVSHVRPVFASWTGGSFMVAGNPGTRKTAGLAREPRCSIAVDAPYAAPTSGGPPFQVYEIRPVRAYGFPTADQFEPTRWEWD